MLDHMQRLGTYVWDHLGHCPFCIRKAFLGGMAAWTCYLMSTFWLGDPKWAILLEGLSVMLTLLWISHSVVFAMKVSGRSKENQVSRVERRALIGGFARAFAFVTLTSAAPRLVLAANPVLDAQSYSMAVQKALKSKGFLKSPIGTLNEQNSKAFYEAIRNFKKANHLGNDDRLDQRTAAALGIEAVCAPGSCLCSGGCFPQGHACNCYCACFPCPGPGC